MDASNVPRVWFITGGSSGFGYRLARIALRRGDKVLTTGRSEERLQKLVQECNENEKSRLRVFTLDFSAKAEDVTAVIDEAAAVWGRIDVLVNNAGWGYPGLIEELGSALVQEALVSNIMGCVNVTFAVLPYMRRQKSGTIVTIGSTGVWRGEIPSLGPYLMCKASIHAFADSLMAELAPCNIRSLLVISGTFPTEGIYRYGFHTSNPIPEYDGLRPMVETAIRNIRGNEPGDTDKAMEVVVDVVRGEGVAVGKPWPKYLPLGQDTEQDIRNRSSTMLNILEEWKDVVRGVAANPA